MGRRFVDLSIAIEMGVTSDPVGFEPRIEYVRHAESVPEIARFFPGLTPDDLPDREGWAHERVILSTHNGTHMDAPYHFHSTTRFGALPAPTIDETPLEQCYAPGVKLDFRHLPDGYVASAQDIEDELARIGHRLASGEIVLVNTRAGEIYGQLGYLDAGCGMGREATLYLTEREVKIVGTDAWSWDAPFSHTAKRWAESRDPSMIWEGHKAGREIPYWQMEKLSNLASLPPFGFEVICFPVKIKGASAGWSRVVAVFEDESRAGPA